MLEWGRSLWVVAFFCYPGRGEGGGGVVLVLFFVCRGCIGFGNGDGVNRHRSTRCEHGAFVTGRALLFLPWPRRFLSTLTRTYYHLRHLYPRSRDPHSPSCAHNLTIPPPPPLVCPPSRPPPLHPLLPPSLPSSMWSPAPLACAYKTGHERRSIGELACDVRLTR